MYRYGMLTTKYAVMLEVRMKIDALMRQGKSKGEAVRETAEVMHLHKATIYAYL